MHHHAGLREKECTERANRKQRDQRVDYTAEGNKKQAGKNRQNDDAVRIDKAPAAVREDGRQETVFGEQPADPREIRETGLSRISEHDEMLVAAA